MATSQLAQTTLRSVLGQHELDEMLAERDRLNADLQRILDEQTESWGIKVSNVELKHVDIDESMIRAIARQAEAERIRRAKIIDSEGEFQAAQKFLDAATHPRAAAAGDAAALSLDPDDHRQRTLVDHRVSVSDRHHPDVERPQRRQRAGAGAALRLSGREGASMKRRRPAPGAAGRRGAPADAASPASDGRRGFGHAPGSRRARRRRPAAPPIDGHAGARRPGAPRSRRQAPSRRD